ncbi:helix-turn-helix transcriptional regulator [Streptomyces sp. SBST2-5]|uniref:Helix-turn-helix transcriptional regulator n=1 Tax=Streptomyces composti TaxID=2720025 RepID=A0ABX1ADH0_9ACTN|nr:helix-turn-helix transcriptional regulator [Streptomyces composti]NJP53072.1 helix-turn-helix transcriptional regulator [Streptomyces composti]
MGARHGTEATGANPANGSLLRQPRGDRGRAEVAARAGISAETLRKIETGRAPTPAFFTIAALAGGRGLSMDSRPRTAPQAPRSRRARSRHHHSPPHSGPPHTLRHCRKLPVART